MDSKMKNLLTSLRAVTELQNPAIRDRHWHQLMAAAGVCITMDQVFILFLIYRGCSCVQGFESVCLKDAQSSHVPLQLFCFTGLAFL